MGGSAGSTSGEPLLRWAGSKRKLLPILQESCPETFGRYIEPFAGSACLFFQLRPALAVLADLNTHLIDMYREVRKDSLAVWRHLSRLPLGEASYYEIRHYFASCPPGPKKAAIFIYLNRFCFNGLYRTNNAGVFNVPYGGIRNGKLPDRSELRRVSQSLAKVILEHGDFEEIVRRNVTKGDLVYMDPPFTIENRRAITYFGTSTFSPKDEQRLTALLDDIDSARASFVLSYAHTPRLNKLFKKWNRRKVSVRRNIAGFAGARRMAFEMLVTN